MANTLKRVTGVASVLGTSIFTVPALTTITIVGCRGSNKLGADTNFHVTINGVLVSGENTALDKGTALDIMADSKIVATAGDVIMAYAANANAVDIYISYLEQS